MSPHEQPELNVHSDRLALWVHEHSRALLGYLLGVVRRRAVAEELLQETFIRAWQARERFSDQGRDRAYLIRIADRLAMDRLRRKSLEKQLDDSGWDGCEPPSGDPMPEDVALHQEACQQLNAALRELSEPQQRTLLLRYYGNLEFHEIAAQLECPLNTVLSHHHRALAAMRRKLVAKTP